MVVVVVSIDGVASVVVVVVVLDDDVDNAKIILLVVVAFVVGAKMKELTGETKQCIIATTTMTNIGHTGIIIIVVVVVVVAVVRCCRCRSCTIDVIFLLLLSCICDNVFALVAHSMFVNNVRAAGTKHFVALQGHAGVLTCTHKGFRSRVLCKTTASFYCFSI